MFYTEIPCKMCYFRPSEGSDVKEEDLVLSQCKNDDHVINLHPASRGEQSKVGVCDETFALDNREFPRLGAALRLELRPARVLEAREAAARAAAAAATAVAVVAAATALPAVPGASAARVLPWHAPQPGRAQ